MAVSATWNGNAAVLEIQNATAKGLVAAALFVQAQHKRLLNVSNPRPYTTPSSPGEYPRKRTGQLQAGVLFAPRSYADAARLGRVGLGYSQQAFYGKALENKGWKGLLDTIEQYKGQIMALIGGAK